MIIKNKIYCSGQNILLATGENYLIKDDEVFVNNHPYKKKDLEVKINGNYDEANPENVRIGVRLRDGQRTLPADFSKYDEWEVCGAQQTSLSGALENIVVAITAEEGITEADVQQLIDDAINTINDRTFEDIYYDDGTNIVKGKRIVTIDSQGVETTTYLDALGAPITGVTEVDKPIGLSIRDENNLQQFVSDDYLQFENSTFDPINNRIKFNGLRENTAFVKLAPITHTPEVGSIEKHFNTLDSALQAVSSLASSVGSTGTVFDILLMSGGAYELEDGGDTSYANVRIISYAVVDLLSSRRASFFNTEIIIPNGRILNRRGSFWNMNGNTKIIANEADTVLPVRATLPYPPIIFNGFGGVATTSNTYIRVNTWTINEVNGSSQYALAFGGSNQDSNIDVKVNTLKFNRTGGSFFYFIVNLGRGINQTVKCNISLKEIDLSGAQAGALFSLFNTVGNDPSIVSTFEDKNQGQYNFEVGSLISNPLNIPIVVLFNPKGGDIKIRFLNSKLGNCQIINQTGGINEHIDVQVTGHLETSSNGYMVDAKNFCVTDISRDRMRILFKDFYCKIIGTARVFYVRNWSDGLVPVKRALPIHFQNTEWDIANNYFGFIEDATTDDPNQFSVIKFFGSNRINLLIQQDYIILHENEVNSPQINNFVVNYGRISHNAVNSDYLDSRSIKQLEDKFIHQL